MICLSSEGPVTVLGWETLRHCGEQPAAAKCHFTATLLQTCFFKGSVNYILFLLQA